MPRPSSVSTAWSTRCAAFGCRRPGKAGTGASSPGSSTRLSEACQELGFAQLEAVIEFAVATAMRRGEILALQWRDVRHNSVMVRRSKTGRQRAVALSPAAKRALERVRRLAPDHVFPEFASPSGDRLLERQWYKVLAEASIVALHFHDLRHESISRLFEKGLILPEVM